MEKQKDHFSKEYFLFICYTLIICVLICLFHSINFSFSVYNFRLISGGFFIERILDFFYGIPLFQKIKSPDDPGYIILYALSAFFSGDKKVLVSYDPHGFPFLLKIFYFLVQIFSFRFLIFTSNRIINLRVKIFVLLFSILPTPLAVFLGYDVYVFPVYAFIVSLYLLGEFIEVRLSISKLICISFFIGICEVMRKWSIFPFYVFLVIIFLKKSLNLKEKIKILMICLSVSLLPKIPGKFLFQAQGHTIWHPIHAGLFEFGGCVDKKGDIFPFFAYENNQVEKLPEMKCEYRWNDLIQYHIGSINNLTDHTSLEYESLLKNQVTDFIKKHSWEVSSLIFMRSVNALSFLPFKSHNRHGHYSNISISFFLEAMFFIFIFFLWLKDKRELIPKFFILLSFGMSLAPSLLVHSQHVIYNYPVNFIQVLIIGMFFDSICQNYLCRTKLGSEI
jgi:hypothetical protein